MNTRHFFISTICAGFLCAVLGCGGKDKADAPQEISAKGTLTINGKSFGPAVLTFQHTTDKSAPGLVAQVKDDGTFDSVTYKAGETVASGKYSIAISEDPDDMSMEGVPQINKTTVEIKVPEEGGTLTLNLKLSAKKGSANTGGPDPDAEGSSL